MEAAGAARGGGEAAGGAGLWGWGCTCRFLCVTIFIKQAMILRQCMQKAQSVYERVQRQASLPERGYTRGYIFVPKVPVEPTASRLVIHRLGSTRTKRNTSTDYVCTTERLYRSGSFSCKCNQHGHDWRACVSAGAPSSLLGEAQHYAGWSVYTDVTREGEWEDDTSTSLRLGTRRRGTDRRGRHQPDRTALSGATSGAA